MKISELEDQAVSQARLIKSLQTEQTELKNGLNDMSKELEIKVKEILQVRSEANQTLKYDMLFVLVFEVTCIFAFIVYLLCLLVRSIVRSFYRVVIGCWQSFDVPPASAEA